MTEERRQLEDLAPWALTPLPRATHEKGPWGLLNTWDHPGLDAAAKRYATSADVWIHAAGTTYYMHQGQQQATVCVPGPTCTCNAFDQAENCIHVHLVKILRGAP